MLSIQQTRFVKYTYGSAGEFRQALPIGGQPNGILFRRPGQILGYSQQMQWYNVQSGKWLRKSRGIFRLKHYPAPFLQDDLYVTYLWTCNLKGEPEGVFSHGTALALYEISTYIPPLFDISVPKNFRRHSQAPNRTKLWKRDMKLVESRMIKGLKVTSPVRTIVDLLQSEIIDLEYVYEAIKTALDRFLILPDDFKKATLTPFEVELLVDTLQKQNYRWIGEIRKQ